MYVPNIGFARQRKTSRILLLLFLAALVACAAQPGTAGPVDWLRRARVTATDLWVEMSDSQLARAIDDLAAQGVNAVDLDFSYEVIDKQVRMVERVLAYARQAHPEMRFFVYQAPLESVSENVDMNRDRKVDPGKTSTYSEHPEWAQRGLGGEPALLYGADAGAFWVGPHDEDVWLCPNDPEYKLVWKSDIARLAATGVDAIYIDVPFLQGWFSEKLGWRWACACDDCKALYKARYGADLPMAADWNDANFRRFVRWRFEQIENFIKEVRETVKAANPKAALIVEHWNGITDSAETACDPAMIARYSDARCHEWTNVDGSTSDYGDYAWLEDMVRYIYYRSVDGGNPSWILGYTDKGDGDRMLAHAALQLSAGCNFWETDAPDMSGSVDEEARTELFGWIGANTGLYYKKSNAVFGEVGLYYSRDSIVFYDFRRRLAPWRCAGEFLGLGMILLQGHVPFVVVTPEGLDDLTGIKVLVLPNTACLSDTEAEKVRGFVNAGGTLVSTGDSGEFDEEGQARGGSVLADLFGVGNPGAGVAVRDVGLGKVIVTGKRIGYDFYIAASPDRKTPRSAGKAQALRQEFLGEVWSNVTEEPLIITDADHFTILIAFTGREYKIAAFRIGAVDGGEERDTKVGFRIPQNMSVRGVDYTAFLEDGKTGLTYKKEAGYATVTIPLRLHGVTRFRFR
jgi:hypothetical protein